ncbi:MAG: hypothetical protein ABI873_06835 [Marmoricola sp.]
MTMHSMTFLFMFLIIAIVVVGGLYVAVRVIGGRVVDGDHSRERADKP